MIYEDVIQKIEEIAPPDLAPDWDNSGVQVFTGNWEIEKILVCLEITEEVIKEAKEKDVDLIISHHPLIFGGLKSINPWDFSAASVLPEKVSEQVTGKYLVELIKADIGVYSAHLTFDDAPMGNNVYLAKLLGLQGVERPEIQGEQVSGVVGELPEERTLKDVKKALASVLQRSIGALSSVGSADKPVRRVAICTGAGGDMLPSAIVLGCDVLITGDVRFHEAQLAKGTGTAIIDGGHFGTEKIFEKNFAKQLQDALGEQVTVMETDVYGDPWA